MMNGISFKSRLTYSVLPIELPPVFFGKRAVVARQIVAGMYPGDIRQKRIVLRKNGGRGRYLAFLLDGKKTKDPELSSTLFLKRLQLADAVAIYCGKEYCEVLRIEKHSIISTNVYLSDKIESVASAIGSECKVLLFSGEERNECAESFSKEFNVPVQRVRDSFFRFVQQPLYSLSILNCRSLRLLLFFILFSFVSFTSIHTASSYKESEQKRLVEERNEYERLLQEEEKRRIQELTERYSNLVKEYELLIKSLPYDPYLVLSILHDTMGSEPKIRSLSVNANEISISLYTRNPIGVIKRFENNKYIYNLDFHSDLEKDGRNLMVLNLLLKYPEYSSDNKLEDKVNELELLVKKMSQRKQSVPGTLAEYQDYLYSLANNSKTSIKQIGTSINNGEFYLSFVSQGRPESVYRFLNQLGKGEKALFYNNLILQYENNSKKITLQSIFPTGIVKSGSEKVIGLHETDKLTLKKPVDMALNYTAPKILHRTIVQNEKVEVVQKKVKNANWLVYMGYLIDAKNDKIFIRNTRDGNVISLSKTDGTHDGYIRKIEDEAEIILNGERYTIKRSQ